MVTLSRLVVHLTAQPVQTRKSKVVRTCCGLNPNQVLPVAPKPHRHPNMAPCTLPPRRLHEKPRTRKAQNWIKNFSSNFSDYLFQPKLNSYKRKFRVGNKMEWSSSSNYRSWWWELCMVMIYIMMKCLFVCQEKWSLSPPHLSARGAKRDVS